MDIRKALAKVTANWVADSVRWLIKNDCGCCHIKFAETEDYEYSVCLGWLDNGDDWVVAWKIGRQSHNNIMQCDFEIDFEMPYNKETGDVDDTSTVIENAKSLTKKECAAIASEMKAVARRVWKDWKSE